MSQPFTTRAQLAEIQGYDPKIIDAMAAAGYDATRPRHHPAWTDERLSEGYKTARRLEIVEALKAAEKAGFLTLNHRGVA